MKHILIPRTLALLTLAVMLLSSCVGEGERPLTSPEKSTSSQAIHNTPAPSPSAEPLWSASRHDPWTQRTQSEPLEMGKLYYKLDPQLGDEEQTNKSSRFVMSFTYVTADYTRLDLYEYLESRGFEKITKQYAEDRSISFVCVTEEEIRSITPESVQEFYELSSAPAVVGIHRYLKPGETTPYLYNSEADWHRADLIWGEHRLSDDYPYSLGTVKFYDLFLPDGTPANGYDPEKRYALFVEIFGDKVADHDKECEQFFTDKGWEVLSFDECSNRPAYIPAEKSSNALIAVTLNQLKTLSIEALAEYYECDPNEIGATFFQATQPIPSLDQ